MPNRLKPLNQFDFTGGVNLRPETFQLAENELPVLLNMEVDPRGGLNVRKGWKAAHTTTVIDGVGTPGYLTATVGTVSTPDPVTLPSTFTFVYKIQGPTGGSSDQTIVGQYEADPQRSFLIRRRQSTGLNIWHATSAGTSATVTTVGLSPIKPITGADEYSAIAVDLTTATQSIAMWESANGTAWTLQTPPTTGTRTIPLNSTGSLIIGASAGTNQFYGRIYWVELRSGLDPAAGSVLWRFDASDYPGTGTSYADPRGRTWTLTTASAITPKVLPVTVWNPRNAYGHIKSNGDRLVLVANQQVPGLGTIYGRLNNANFTSLTGNTATAAPHIADFASWDDLVWIVRGFGATLTWDGIAATVGLGLSGGADGTTAWQDDYTNPGSTKYAPMGDLIAQHAGYMFIAGTHEGSTTTTHYPNRIRWSHPNNPYAWAKADYIDLSEGGQKITAMIPYSDRLLIFKPDSVWALFGYDADTWELTNISRTVGCVHQQAICRNESGVFFLSWPQGIFAYTEKGNVQELSVPIRVAFQSHNIDPAAVGNVWLGWVDRRLWCSLPFNIIPAPDDAETVFVWDPVLTENGSWTIFQGADFNTPGPYLERVDVGVQSARYAFMRQTPYMVVLDDVSDAAEDECVPNVVRGFPTRMRTRWLDAGAPTWKKSWRRPDLLLRALKINTVVNCRVYHDFDSSNAERSFQVFYTPDNPYTLWGHFNYGDGTKYGGSDQTTSVERGGTMGRAGTIQLLIEGDPGISWGLNGVIFKYIPRRFR